MRNGFEGIVTDGKEAGAVTVGEDTRGTGGVADEGGLTLVGCLLYTSPSPRD